MGRSISWIVVEAADADAVAQALAVRRTGRSGMRDTMPLAGRKLDTSRYLIVADGVDHPAFAKAKLAALSTMAPLTFCELEEHVNWTSAQRWECGRVHWSVRHQGENSDLDLQTAGELPAEFVTLNDAALAAQNKEDEAEAAADLAFNLPLALARVRTGMHPDDADFGAGEFESLDAGLTQRWRDLPLLVRLLPWAAGLLFAAWALGALLRRIF